MPTSDIEIDTSLVDPPEAALAIKEKIPSLVRT